MRLLVSRLGVGFLLLGLPGSPATAQIHAVRLAVQEDVRTSDLRTLSPALERVIALDLRNVSIANALGEIGRKADLPLVYSSGVLPAGKRVTLRAQRIT